MSHKKKYFISFLIFLNENINDWSKRGVILSLLSECNN